MTLKEAVEQRFPEPPAQPTQPRASRASAEPDYVRRDRELTRQADRAVAQSFREDEREALRAEKAAAKAAANPFALTPEMKMLRTTNENLGVVERLRQKQIEDFDRGAGRFILEAPLKGMDTFGELLELDALEQQAAETVGTIRGALTPGVAAGDPSEGAVKARQRMAELVQKAREVKPDIRNVGDLRNYREALRQERQRLLANAEGVKKRRAEIAMQYGSQMAALYGIPPADIEPEVAAQLTPDPIADAEKSVAEGRAKPELVGTIRGIVNAAQNAFDSSRQALTAANGLDENDAAELARLEYQKAARASAPGYDAYQKAEGWDAVKAFIANPVEVTSNIVAEGLAGSIPIIASGLGTGAAFAGTAGVAGSVVPGAGNLLGAGGGFTAGMVVGTGAGSFAVEYGGKILEELQKSGMDLQDPESIAEFFANEQALAAAKEKAVKRGVPVAVFDALSAGLAGRLGSVAKSALRTPTRVAAAEVAAQGLAGGAGEVAGSLAAGDPVSGKAVFGEIIGEVGPGAVEIGAGRLASRGQQQTAPAAVQPQQPATPAQDTPPPSAEESDTDFTPEVDDELAAEMGATDSQGRMVEGQTAQTEPAPAIPAPPISAPVAPAPEPTAPDNSQPEQPTPSGAEPISQEPPVGGVAAPQITSEEQKPTPTGSSPVPADTTREPRQAEEVETQGVVGATSEADEAPAPVSTVPAPSAEKAGAEAKGMPGESPADRSSFALPRDLAGAKPSYAYGSKQFTLKFASDLDKALYIVAQKTPSKRDADYLKAIAAATGMTEAEARRVGATVRNAIKVRAKDAEAGELAIPPLAPTRRAPDPLPSAAAPAATEADQAGSAPARPTSQPAAETPSQPPASESDQPQAPTTAPTPGPAQGAGLVFEQAKAQRDAIEAEVRAADAALKAIPGVGSGTSGLTPDAVKSTPAYAKAKADFDRAFARQRAFNQSFTKRFKAELAAERAARRPADAPKPEAEPGAGNVSDRTAAELNRRESEIKDTLARIEKIGAKVDKFSKSSDPAGDRAKRRASLREELKTIQAEQDKRARAQYAASDAADTSTPSPRPADVSKNEEKTDTSGERASNPPVFDTRQPVPIIPRGENKPAEFVRAIGAAVGMTGSDRPLRAVADLAVRLHRAAPANFEGMEVNALSEAEWKANPATGSMTPDSAAAYNPETNTLFLRTERLKDSTALVSALVHESGHFAERFALPEALIAREWAKLDDAQIEQAAADYNPDDQRTAAEIRKDARARSEWVAQQFARVVAGKGKSVPDGIRARLEAFFAAMKEFATKWLGSDFSSSPAFDAEVLRVMGFDADAMPVTPSAVATPSPTPSAPPASLPATATETVADLRNLTFDTLSRVPGTEQSDGVAKNKGKVYRKVRVASLNEQGEEWHYNVTAERSGGGVKVEADRKTDRQLDKEKASKWESYPQEIRSAVERIFGESAPNQSQKNVIAGLMSGEPKSQINDMTVNAVFGLRRMEQLAKELGSAPKTTDEIRAGLRSLASLPATAGVTSPGAEAETVDLMEGYIFPGNLEPGQISQDKRVVVGNFRIKKQAEEVAKGIQGAGVVPYLNGKFKRGWVVLQPTSESRSLEGARIERGRQEDERRREERRVEQEARRVQAEKENAERAKEQAKRDAIPAPKTPGALPFTETRKALLAQVDEAIAKAPDPKDFLDKAKAVVAGRANAFKKNAGESFDDFKKRLNDYIANAPLELAKEMATDSLSPRERTVKFTAGTANYKIPNTREAMEQFRKLVAGSIRSTPQARESTVLPKLTGEEMDMVRNAKETGRLEDPFIRGLLDRATDGQFDSLRLSDRYTRVAPGVVMPKEGAEALAALKRGEQPGFDVLGTPAESLRDVTSAWDARGIRHAVFEKGGVITLNDIRIPEGERNAGLGTQAMQELTRYADSKGARIALSPSLDFGATSLPRLKDFYKRLGFVENKGRNRDFAISESMIREPSSATLGTPAERQTDTPEFRRWFGDSKVVDARGKPLVVYHGTTKDFDVFDVARAGSNIDTGYLGTAAGYFTDRADIADYYSRRDATGSATYPVYLSLKNPFMWGKKTRGVQGLYWNGERLPDEIHDEVIRATGFKFDGKIYPPDNEVAERDLSLAVRRVLMRKGYDGVIANDSKGKPMEFVAFGPEQIKSAIGNSGAFDPANPSILGTPADTAPEKRVSQSPRTERSGGFAVPDQVYAADRPFTVLQDEARAHVAKVGEARAVEDALDDASALPGDTKQTIILNAFKALSARMLDPNTSASEQESLTREMETLSARANPGTRSVARELSARQQYNRDQRVASPMQHVEEVRKRQEGAIGPDGNAALDDAEGELNKPVREVSNEIAKRAKEKAKGVKVSKGMIEDYLRKLEEENPDSIAVVALIKAMERNPADRAQAIRDFIDETRKTLWVEYRDAIAAAAEKTAKGPGKKKGKALLQVLPDDIQKIITDAIPKADAKGVPFSAQDMANRINDILARPEQFKDALGAARRQIGASEMDDARKQAALDALASLSSGQNIVGDMLNKIVKSVFDDMDLTPKQAARMGNVKSDEIAGEVSKRVAALFSGDVAKQMSREVSSIVGNMLNDARSQIREQLTSAEIKKQFLTAEEVKQADALLATGTVEEIAAFLGTRKSPQENERIAALTKELSEKKAKLSAILRKNLYQLSKEDQAQVIRDAFKAMQTTVGEIAKQHVTRTNATAKDLARRLVEEAGLSQAVASQVAADLDAAARKMIAEAREKALAKLKAKAEADTPRAKKIVTAIGKLTTLNNLGALTRADLMKAVAKELNLPEVRAEDMRRIAELADKVETAPNGLARSRAQRDLMVAVRVAQGISAADVGLSVWLSNLLSGPMTQVGNLVGNSMHTSAQIMALAMTNPSRARFAFSGWVDGLGAGFTHARDILKTGTSLREMGELNESTKTGDIGNVLEAVNYERDFKRLPKNLARGLQIHANAMRYVSRAMRAADAVFFYPAKEAYAQVMTAKLLEGEYKGKELVQKVRESLGMAPDQFIRFTRQAEAEGFTDSLDKAIRVHQLIEEARANSGAVQKTDAASNEFGKETTYNQEPVGTAGIVYRIAREGVNKLPALRLILPFLRTPTNVFNASLNFTPLGALRAGMGTTALNAAEKLAEQSAGFKPLVPLGKAAAWLNPGGTKDTDGKTTKQFTAEERARLYFQSVAGTIGMATIAAAALAEADDEDPFFTITAKGTGDWKKNEQLQQAGWRPFSIKVGNNYYNYRDTPFLLPLAAIGHIVDAKRYQKTKDTLAGRNPYLDALFRMPPTIFETSMLSGLGIIADVATGDFSPAKMEAFVANSATSAIIPNAVKQVDRFVSQERRDIDGIGGRVGASVPVLRQTGSVETDVLGEAVTTSPGDRLFSTGTDDELRQVLRDKKAFISVPDKDTRLDGRTMTEEEFKAYYRFYGEEMGRRLRPMTATLRRMQPGEQIGKLVDRVEADAREAAKAKVRQTVRRVPVLPDL